MRRRRRIVQEHNDPDAVPVSGFPHLSPRLARAALQGLGYTEQGAGQEQSKRCIGHQQNGGGQ